MRLNIPFAEKGGGGAIDWKKCYSGILISFGIKSDHPGRVLIERF